ncbi:MAG TPA: alpha/beta hydrolase [Anaerolineaceae bacterium]|nr:alpha/beta hydrolase [Anaerolineaceae bacterium]
MTGRTGYVTVEEGVRLFYQMRGEGSPTLIVPGACLLAADLEPLAENRTVLFYDDRGRGASDPPADPWDIWTQYEVDDLEAIRRAFGLERIQLFGWAYFAGAAALYAMAYPERVERMALVCPITPHYPAPYSDEVISLKRTEERIPLEALQQLEQMQRDGLDESDPVAYCRAYSAVFTRQAMARPEALERMRSQPCLYSNEWPKNFMAHWQSHFPESSWQRDWRAGLRTLAVPTLVVHGMHDLLPVEAAQEWVENLPQARLLRLEDAGHMPHREAPEAFFPALQAFFSGEG